jgi:hypothetical protein
MPRKSFLKVLQEGVEASEPGSISVLRNATCAEVFKAEDGTIKVLDTKEVIIAGQREAKAKADAGQQQAKAETEAKQRQTKADADAKRQFEKTLTADTPQAMYLAGVKYEDNGDSGRAKKVYSTIMDRFPQDALAIKAADRLLSLRNAGQAQTSAANQAQANTSSCYKQCSAFIEACLAQCAGFSDKAPDWATASKQTECRSHCSQAESECRSGCR